MINVFGLSTQHDFKGPETLITQSGQCWTVESSLSAAPLGRPWRVHQDDPVLLHVVLVGCGGGQRVNVDDTGRRHSNELKIAGAEATTAAGEPDSTRQLPAERAGQQLATKSGRGG